MGGTFDPIHNGHLQVALEAQRQLGLTRVLFVPAGQPWMKNDRQITPAGHRVEMVRLAIEGKQEFSLSTIDIERQGPTYTIDTLRQLAQEINRKADLFLILSWNTLAELPGWREPREIIRLCTIVAAPRPGYRKPDLHALETKIPGISQKVVFLDKPVINISATAIRESVSKGQPITDMVPASVAKYIQRHRLYK